MSEQIKSKYADVLNALSEMQYAVGYAVRRHDLLAAENTIVALEREATALRDECARYKAALKALVSEVGSYTVERTYYSREQASKDLDRREKALIQQLQHAKAALTPPEQEGGGR